MRHDNATHKNCHETRQIEAFGKNIGQIGANSQHRQFKSGKVTQFRVFEELKRKIVGEIKKQEILRFFIQKYQIVVNRIIVVYQCRKQCKCRSNKNRSNASKGQREREIEKQ